MTVLIDADACPVVDIAVRLCGKYHVPCVLLCDTAHILHRDGAQTLVFDKGADSADIVEILVLAGVKVYSVHKNKESLEEYYISVTTGKGGIR